MADMLTPEEIEAASFDESRFGYDRARVDGFLIEVAQEVRRLRAEAELAAHKAEKPYLGAGKEIGSLLERAQEVADRIRNDTEAEASRMLQDARRKDAQVRDELDRLTRNARTEAESVLERARAKATRLREQAEYDLKAGEARCVVIKREAVRDAKEIRSRAKREAHKLRADAEREVAQATASLERKARKLREAEATLRRRMQALAAHHEELGSAVDGDNGTEPRTIVIEDAPTST